MVPEGAFAYHRLRSLDAGDVGEYRPGPQQILDRMPDIVIVVRPGNPFTASNKADSLSSLTRQT